MEWLVGGALVVGGILWTYGAVSGRLAAMIGALVGIGGPVSGQSATPYELPVGGLAQGALPPTVQKGITWTDPLYWPGDIANTLKGWGL